MKTPITLIICLIFSSAVTSQAGLFDKQKEAVMEKVAEKAKAKLIELRKNLIEISKAGFVAEQVHLTGALNPKLAVIFVDKGTTGNEAAVLERNKDNKALTSTLKMLIALRKIKVESYRLTKLKVEFGFPPKVTWIATVDGL